MKNYTKIIILALFTTLLTSCGPSRSEPTTQAKVFLGALTGFSNSVMLYGGSLDTNQTFAKKILPSDSNIDLELTQGNWTFYALYWDGSQPFEGNLSCYNSTKTIQGESMEINITLSQTNCNNPNIFPSTLNPQDPFVFTGCANLNDVTSFSSTCQLMSKGAGNSYRIIYPSWSISNIETASDNATIAMASSCITPGTATNMKVPVGSTNSFFNPIVYAYGNTTCSGDYRELRSLQTFRKTTNLETREYSDSSNNYMFFADRSDETLSVISTSIGDTCDMYFDMQALSDKTVFLSSNSTAQSTIFTLDEQTNSITEILPSNNSTTHTIKLGNQLFFNSQDSTNGTELWVTDGTIPGTFLLKDINTGPSSSWPSNFFMFNSKVYFSASSSTEGYEIWTTDGTAAGTYLVSDINPGTSSGISTPFFTILGSNLYFVADNGTTGSELYRMNSSESIELVADINIGSTGSWPAGLINYNGRIYFRADNGIDNSELYSYDGSSLIKLTNIPYTSTFINEIQILNNHLVFSLDYDGTTYGIELYKHDGITVNDETLISDINTGVNSSSPQFITKLENGDLIYNVSTGTNMELMRVDSSFNTFIISNGSSTSTIEDSITYNGKTYMILSYDSSTPKLYKYDPDQDTIKDLQGVCPTGCTSWPQGKFGISAKGNLYLKKLFYDGTDYIINIFRMGL